MHAVWKWNCNLLTWEKTEKLDTVDLDLSVQTVVAGFGPFLRYRTVLPSAECSSSAVLVSQNAFAMLMNSARTMVPSDLPNEKLEHNGKDKLYNEILKFLNLVWNSDLKCGEKLVHALTESLWYIDGHHHLLSERSNIPVPAVFAQFQGYNLPELSKHRKRTLANLNSTTLEHHSRALATCLDSTYWDSSSWKKFKPDFAQLTESVAGYVTHLAKKRKEVSKNQSSVVPVRSLSENMQLYHIPLTGVSEPAVATLSSALLSMQEYEPAFVNDFAPSEPLPKHRYVEILKKGLPCQCLLFCYAPGSNIGNQYYIWKVGADTEDPSEHLSNSQRTIEDIKTKLPIFHSRARILVSKHLLLPHKMKLKISGQLCLPLMLRSERMTKSFVQHCGNIRK